MPEESKEVLSGVKALRGIKDSVILAEWHGKGRPRAAGLSIVFFRLPEAIEFNRDDYDAYFEEERIQFAADTRWDEFLAAYHQEAGG
ncbi:MAG: hypothetical protein HZA19_04485 [Nitrospirae bacterium]|nr:hypothetical protein [Nitrospirota bacterium]